jgi:hypothetical protein
MDPGDTAPDKPPGGSTPLQLPLLPDAPPRFSTVIPPEVFPAILAAVIEEGWGDDISWSESVEAPATAEEFASEAIFVICNSGMRFTVAQGIFERCMNALRQGASSSEVFGHAGKCGAIDQIWFEREQLLAAYREADDKVAWCETLPWIGGITKYHLAKNLGADVAKPDVHLQRLGHANGCSAAELCRRLAEASGLRVATVDVVLWRACAIGLIKSREAGE